LGVADRLDPRKTYGVVWTGRHNWRVIERVRLPDGEGYRNLRKHTEKPKEEWIGLPVPGSGVPRGVAERARRNVELRVPAPPKKGRRFWDLSGGVLRCAECGRAVSGHTVSPRGRKRSYYYYVCPSKVEEYWKTACPNRNHRAADLEARVRGFVTRLIENPDTLREQVEQQARAARESKPWVRDAREAATTRERLAKLEAVADKYRDQQAEGFITMTGLREKLDGLAEERETLEARLEALADRERGLREL
jgi:hypothetical protein